MGVSKTSGHIKIKINMLNLSQEPPASSKGSNKNLKDIDALCAFKIKIESPNFDHRCIKNQRPYPNQDQDAKPQSGTSRSSKAPYDDLKDMDVLCTFKIKIKSQNLEHRSIKDQ